MNFRDYVKTKIKNDDNVLEFGPLNRPLLHKREFTNIYYADVKSTNEIKKLYTSNDYLKKTGIIVDVSTIVDIDYIIKGSYKETFGSKKFDVIYLSHVVEHIPNIIGFFQEVYDLLKKDGRLIIIYPDKKYCFDHFRNSASFRDAYSTYKFGLKENSRLAFDFSYNVVSENNPKFFWESKNIVNVISKNSIEDAMKYYETINNNKEFEDIHFWPFSDYDFLLFIYEMKRAKLFKFEIEEYFPTEINNQEFMVILKKQEFEDKDMLKIKSLINNYNPQKEKIESKEKIEYLLLTEEKSRKQISEINNLIEKNKKEIGSKNKIILNLKKEITRKNSLIETNKQEIELKNKIILELKEEITKIYNSKSMKITKPLRFLMKILKKGGQI